MGSLTLSERAALRFLASMGRKRCSGSYGADLRLSSFFHLHASLHDHLSRPRRLVGGEIYGVDGDGVATGRGIGMGEGGG